MAYTTNDRRDTGGMGGLTKAARRGVPGAAETLEIVKLGYALTSTRSRAHEAAQAATDAERKVRDRVAEIVAQAPPLSPEQRTRLAAILAATAGEGDAA